MQKITDKQLNFSVVFIKYDFWNKILRNYCFPDHLLVYLIYQIKWKWKNDFYGTKIEQKFRVNKRNFRENEIENFVESTSKFAKVLNENERISFIHFRGNRFKWPFKKGHFWFTTVPI